MELYGPLLYVGCFGLSWFGYYCMEFVSGSGFWLSMCVFARYGLLIAKRLRLWVVGVTNCCICGLLSVGRYLWGFDLCCFRVLDLCYWCNLL